MKPCCPTCGRAFPKPQAGKPLHNPLQAVPHEDPAMMTDRELFAYYKRTALIEDLRFFLRGTLSPALRARAEALTKPTAVDLANLRAAWRTERNEYDRAHGIPAVGSETPNQSEPAEIIESIIFQPVDQDGESMRIA